MAKNNSKNNKKKNSSEVYVEKMRARNARIKKGAAVIAVILIISMVAATFLMWGAGSVL
ncbi:MAG: hypothetical protein HUJ78_02130 [Mogibacterium sp.]|nr:hypothetical protein [Mogibacterium sp.]